MKELYEKGKGRSVRGFASTCGRRRCRSPRPDRKRGSKLDAYTEYIDVRMSEVLENCVALIVDEFGIWPYDRESATAFFSLVSARYKRGSIILTSNKGFCGLERAAGRHGDSDGDPQQAAAPESRAQHPRRELQAEGQASGQSANVPPAVHINILRLTLTEGIRMRVNQIQLGENARRPTAH